MNKKIKKCFTTFLLTKLRHKNEKTSFLPAQRNPFSRSFPMTFYDVSSQAGMTGGNNCSFRR